MKMFDYDIEGFEGGMTARKYTPRKEYGIRYELRLKIE